MRMGLTGKTRFRTVARGHEFIDLDLLVHHLLSSSSQEVEMTAGSGIGGWVIFVRHGRLWLSKIAGILRVDR